MDYAFENFNYSVLSGRFTDPSKLSLYEKVYDFWFENWTNVFADLKVDFTPNPNDFFRQDYIPVITYKGEVMAMQLCTLFDLRTIKTRNQSYIQHNFSQEFFDKIRSKGFQFGMSMEALFVDPNFRKSLVGYSISKVLLALVQKVFSDISPADIAFAPARVDVKVAESLYEMGWNCVQKDYALNNVTVDLIYVEREQIKSPKSSIEESMVKYLWDNRCEAHSSLPPLSKLDFAA